MVQRDQQPSGWDELIYANLDGSFHDTSNYFGNLDIDTQVMRLLDAKETLDIVRDALDAS